MAESANQSLEMRRAAYACKANFVTLDSIMTWNDYYKLKHLKSKYTGQPENLFAVNESLNKKVSIWSGDITRLEIDVIVNAAHESLLGGAGVDGAIHKAAGPELLDKCETLERCEPGHVKLTRGYKLPAKYIIHAVGPRNSKPEVLRACYDKSLDRMIQENLHSIAFPCISTGVFGYPNEAAAHVAILAARHFLEKHGDQVDRIIFCIFLNKDLKIYEKLMQQYFPVEGE